MKSKIPLVALTVALIAAACGGSDDEAEDTSTTAPPTTAATTTTVAETTTTIATTTTPAEPEGVTIVGADGVESMVTDVSRIVSLNGDITEIIYELGLGDAVVGIDVTTTYPEEALAAPIIGFGQQLAAEGVLSVQPTLVIGDQQIQPPETLEQIRAAGVPVVILETKTTVDGALEKITEVAEVLGVPEAGADLADRVSGEIEEARALAAQVTDPVTAAYVYIRGPQTVLLFGNGMITQSMIESANAIDGGAASGVFGALPLTPEALVAAAPDVLIVPEAGYEALGGADALLEIPGVAETPAGAARRFLDFDEAYFLGISPRIGQALRDLVVALYPEVDTGS